MHGLGIGLMSLYNHGTPLWSSCYFEYLCLLLVSRVRLGCWESKWRNCQYVVVILIRGLEAEAGLVDVANVKIDKGNALHGIFDAQTRSHIESVVAFARI